MNPCVKTKGKSNELVNSKLKIMRKSNSLHQIMRENDETKHVFKLRFIRHMLHCICKKKEKQGKKQHYFFRSNK